MNILEAQFRRQFQAEGAGYRFVRDGQEVGFSAEEVETFVEEWARLWLAPWLWGGWLLVGVAAPFLLARNGYDGGAWTLGMLAAMFMVAVLVPVLQKPGQAADARLTGEPEGSGGPWGGPWIAPIGSGIWVCISMDMVVRSGGTDLSKVGQFFIWTGLFLMFLWRAIQQRRGKIVDGKPDLVGTIVMESAIAGFVIVTALNPNRSLFDLVLAGLFLVLAAIGAIRWRRLRNNAA